MAHVSRIKSRRFVARLPVVLVSRSIRAGVELKICNLRGAGFAAQKKGRSVALREIPL